MINVNEAIIIGFQNPSMNNFEVSYDVWLSDTSYLGRISVGITKSSIHSNQDWRAAANAALSSLLNANGYATPTSFWNALDGETVDWNTQVANKPSIPSTTRTTSTITPSLVGTGATGTQISATKDASIRVNVSVSTTANLATAATSTIVLKKCATNSATEANWTTVATLENDQTLGLLGLSLSSLQIIKGQLVADIPAGWYYKLVNSGTGTHTETALTGEQTIYG